MEAEKVWEDLKDAMNRLEEMGENPVPRGRDCEYQVEGASYSLMYDENLDYWELKELY